MMEDQETLRRAMGLSDLGNDNDKIVKQKAADFTTRKKLQNLVLKTTIAEKPEGPALWATEKAVATAAGPAPKCHMQVTVVSVSATVPRGNQDGSDINDIPKEFFIPRELASEWSIEKLFYSNSNLTNLARECTWLHLPIIMDFKTTGCMSHPISGMQSLHLSKNIWINTPAAMPQEYSKKTS